MRTGSGAGSDADTADVVLSAEINCPPRMLVAGSSARLCIFVIVSSAACHLVALCTALMGRHVQYQVVACTTHIHCPYNMLVGVQACLQVWIKLFTRAVYSSPFTET